MIIDRHHKCDAPYGNDCWFMRSMGKGIKFYHSEESRDHSYNFQTYLYQKGLAPRTYFKCLAHYCNGQPIFAFETQLAETCYTSDRDREEFLLATKVLETQLLEVGIFYNDWIAANVGFINNKPVVIDCGYPMDFLTNR